MSSGRLAVVGALFACLSCGPSPARVEVQLVTDYVGGADFDLVTITLGGGSLSTPATADRSYGRAVRVAVFEGVAPERARVAVSLLLAGRPVQSQPRIVDLHAGQTSIVTVAITRDCAGVMCPADTPSAIACLGGRCVEPTEDSDMDGIADTADDCPSLANPLQEDEDGDGLGNECDPCPPYTDGDPIADADHDGVSDECDPHPAAAGDRIVRFEGFDHMPAGLAQEGTWEFAGGQAIAHGVLNQRNALTIPRPSSSTGTETVSTHATVDAYFGTDNARPLGVIHELQPPTTPGGIVCVFGTNPSNSEVFAIADDMTLSALVTFAATAPIGASATVVSTRANDAYTCASPVLSGPMMATSSFRSSLPFVGIYTRSVSASFDWMLVTTTP